jgi:hypothetical protein
MKTRAAIEAGLCAAQDRLAQLRGTYHVDLETGFKTFARPDAIAATEAEIAGLQTELAALDAIVVDTSMELPVNSQDQASWAKAFAGGRK